MPDSQISSSDLKIVPTELHPLFEVEGTIIPSETQNRAIDSALHTLRAQLDHARLRSGESAERVGSNADKLEALVQRLAVLRSPVQRLPPEVLGAIFEFCIGERSDWLPISAQGPLWLARVCRVWREIAHSDPRLWTSISFYFPDSSQDRERDVSRARPALDLWLTKSASLPISLTFIDHRIHHSATEDLIALLVDRLRNNSRRWKNISLKLSCGYFPLLFTFTPCDLASLESLSIGGDVLAYRVPATLRLNLESAPNLKSFTYNAPGQYVDDSINLDWERLTEVSFEFVQHRGPSSTLLRHFRHLEQCQNITTCSLGIGPPSHLIRRNGQTVTLPCFQTLRVRQLVSGSHARSVIDGLVLPHLQTLEIDAALLVIWGQRWHDRQFSNLLARSRCDLERLSIKDVHFPNGELLRCLALSPKLTSLCLIPCPRSHNILDVIRHVGDSESESRSTGRARYADRSLVPRLRELALGCAAESYFDPIMGMLQARGVAAAGVDPIRRFELVFFDLWHATDEHQIQAGRADRQLKVASFCERLARFVAENDSDKNVAASLTVIAPYLPQYIDIDSREEVGNPGLD